MLLIRCPHCGPRPEVEFAYGGEAHIARPADPMSLNDEEWVTFLYMRSNAKGMHNERWRHANGCGRFFNASRDTTTDEIKRTYPAGQRPEPENAGALNMAGNFRVRRDTESGRKVVRFTFDGEPYEGVVGDTLASALLANGVHLTGRSFKYHRPRGIVTAGSEEPNALVGVGATQSRYSPNLRATQVELYDGLVAESQNRWPSLALDAGVINDALASFLPAGFYYKTFMWPRAAWKKLYEPLIRRAAGLGRAPAEADADRYTQVFAHCDILVVGAGPAGLAAALAAADSGADVILCDEQAEMGGTLLLDRSATIDGKPCAEWLAAALKELRGRPNVRLLPRTTAFGWYPHNFLGLNERVTDHLATPPHNQPRERLWQVRAKEVVLATGAIERPLVFTDNDRPGIMLADAVRSYVNRYGVLPGRDAVVFTACDSAYRAALDLKAAGGSIRAIVDIRANPSGHWIEQARAEGIDIRTDSMISGTSGRLRVKSAAVTNRASGKTETLPCDLILMSGGFTPSVHLFSQSRGKLVYDDVLLSYVPGQSVERERSVGACTGTFALADVLKSGLEGGQDAVQKAGFSAKSRSAFAAVAQSVGSDAFVGSVELTQKRQSRAWVDFQNDVTAKDVRLATREGFRSIEHVKRYTTTGMATDQGKLSNMNALGIVSSEIDVPISKVGLTTFRPPYTPVTFGSFAGQSRGELFDPVRRTSIHDWAAENGASFEDVGVWKRAWYFPKAGETMHAAVARECKAVRESVGMFDASTLGKIEIVGKDAAEFMNRMYTNAWLKLEPGRLRYGVMLREDGFIMDDGVVGRMAPDRFHVTTTTGGAARVLSVMEDYLQTEWPDLEVWLTSTTEQWAVIAVQGPNARKVLEPLVQDIDLSNDAMPHMSVREGSICGVPTRLFRVSFSGELGFEVNVPAGYGRAVWEAISAEGQAYGITPYGTETMHVLRAEKGFIIVGQETDGTVTPDDVGLGWAVGKAKRDFVGKRSLARSALVAPDRKQLVGLLTTDPSIVLEEGAQIVVGDEQSIPVPMIGHVTSSYWSATLDRSLALALVRGGRSRIGEELSIPMPDGVIKAKVVDAVFYDPKECASVLDLSIMRSNSLRRASAEKPGAVEMAVLPDAAKLIFRGRDAAVDAVGKAFGVVPGREACRFTSQGARTVYWLGPDEWMLHASGENPVVVYDTLSAAMASHSCSLVDVSHRSDALSVTGHNAAWVLNHGCALNLSLTEFPVGMCTRTVIGKAAVILSRTADDTFHVDVWRSFAPYVWQFLDEARSEL